ncbi:hypothetical protein HY621_02420 [Candidatus Uhrbacteria bacterium]|nr:hypothetical protein [Candidatus Uhrbacteria bacterium]
MRFPSKQELTHKTAGIILGIFLFVFSIVGACLFSSVSSQAVTHIVGYKISHMNMDSSGSMEHMLTLIHPEGEFFTMSTSSSFLFKLLFFSIFIFLVLVRIPIIPFIKKKWHQFQRWAELHYSHSPYLLLLQDGTIHPKIF